MNGTSPSTSAADTAPKAVDFYEALVDRVERDPWIGSLRAARCAASASPSIDWGRIGAIALALAAHLAALLQLLVPPAARSPEPMRSAAGGAPAADSSPAQSLQVLFVTPARRIDVGDAVPERAAAALASTSPTASASPSASATVARPASVVVARMSKAQAVAGAATVEPQDADALPVDSQSVARPIRLYRSDGSILLPESVLEDLRAVDGDERMFSFMVPGLASAESAFKRPPAIDYTPTRFDADWKPVRSIGEDALVAVSEALTYENRSGTFRCSLVPPVCTWGRIGTAVELNDPLTLNQAEAEQCQALWVSIVEATDQQAWLRLRRRFDAECRKPLEIDRAVPAPRVEATESR